MSWLQTTEQKTRSYRSRTLDLKLFENKDSVRRKNKYHTKKRERERQKKHQPGKRLPRWQESQSEGAIVRGHIGVWQLPCSGHFAQNRIEGGAWTSVDWRRPYSLMQQCGQPFKYSMTETWGKIGYRGNQIFIELSQKTHRTSGKGSAYFTTFYMNYKRQKARIPCEE